MASGSLPFVSSGVLRAWLLAIMCTRCTGSSGDNLMDVWGREEAVLLYELALVDGDRFGKSEGS